PKQLKNISYNAFAATLMLTLWIQISNSKTPAKENFRETAQYLSQNTAPQDIVFISPPFTIYPIEYYYQGQAQIFTIPEWNRYISG
ncbi:hypothetical protein N4A85_24950, partial [Escherichia coli]|uniref:hypothetical protein n=1 Tax=Escherichia coli TaxID=562 RepID=UPI0021B6045C